MKKFKLPAVPQSTSKSIRFPNEVIEQAQAQAQAIIAQGRRMARQRLEGAPLEEEPMKRYAHPIPYCIDCPTPPSADGLDRILEALACQNQLLVELLGAVNALTAATLSIQSRL